MGQVVSGAAREGKALTGLGLGDISKIFSRAVTGVFSGYGIATFLKFGSEQEWTLEQHRC